MPRPQKDPLRALTVDERTALEHLSRSRAAPAAEGIRATELLAVAAGRTSGDAVAQLVARFNRQGLAALSEPRHAGQPKRSTQVEQERMLQEVRRQPDREQDGTATWSLTTLQRAVRRAPDGLPTVSPFTIWQVRQEAGFRWGRDRTWCATGTVVRQRRSGTVTVTDPDAVAKTR
jgi:transposase